MYKYEQMCRHNLSFPSLFIFFPENLSFSPICILIQNEMKFGSLGYKEWDLLEGLFIRIRPPAEGRSKSLRPFTRGNISATLEAVCSATARGSVACNQYSNSQCSQSPGGSWFSGSHMVAHCTIFLDCPYHPLGLARCLQHYPCLARHPPAPLR